MENKTPLQMLIEWMDKNSTHCTYGTIRKEATELLPVEKEREARLQERVKELEGFLKEILNKSEPHPHYLSFELFEQGTELLTKTQTQ